MMWEWWLNMTTSLATRSTLLPSRDIRHALAGAAVELLVLVVRDQAGARGGMWGVDHRLRGQVWWGGGVLWSTGEGGKHVWGRDRAWRLMVWRTRARCVGDIRHQLRLGGVGSMVHQVRWAQAGGLGCLGGGQGWE